MPRNNQFMLLDDNSDDHDEQQIIKLDEPIKELIKEPIKEPIKESTLEPIIDNNKRRTHRTQKQPKTNEWNDVDKKCDNTDSQKNNESVFRDEKLLENKVIYDESVDYGDIGNDKKLNSHWTVWVHRLNCNDWTIAGYQKIYVINSIGSFWRFFNNFQLINTYTNQIFIMREEIAPIWEDVNNKFGGICSVKIDSIQRGMKTDLSTESFATFCMLIMNETLVQNNKNINGISYSVKKRASLVKIWTKTYDETKDFTKELPVTLINKFNQELQRQSKSVLNNDGKISIQYKQIKPEYDLN
jgi:hypothetical protein